MYRASGFHFALFAAPVSWHCWPPTEKQSSIKIIIILDHLLLADLSTPPSSSLVPCTTPYEASGETTKRKSLTLCVQASTNCTAIKVIHFFFADQNYLSIAWVPRYAFDSCGRLRLSCS
ncbi:uncharacterized protein B0T23DRAFT_376093 [Neurospora hispaniola]|uniref:Uncharacterized protein n=1 Tax=Neurospora hispaniola TaxID=588809 RepID=A0AAJ0I926_9PEZI|nr:hypothetical protein B0T23DRAFT_376093 [Neurospora hispaniola]